MNLLAISWSQVGLQAGQLLLALSILIILHEFGHYITARWFKCRVEKFFLFFDPWFALVNRMTIERGGKIIELNLPVDLIGQLVENRNKSIGGFVEPRTPIVAFIVPDTSRIYRAGLRKNDQIIGVDSGRFQYFDELQNQLKAKKNKTVAVTVLRDGHEVSFPAQVDSSGRLGFIYYGAGGDFDQM